MTAIPRPSLPHRDNRTKTAYNAVAPAYAENAFAKQWMRSHSEQFCAQLSPGSRVLDLGCGPGHDTGLFVQHAMQVVGVDFSEAMIAEAQKRVPGAHFLCQDMREMAFEAGSFAGIWSVGSLHHLPKADLPGVIHTIYTMLAEGGIVFISIQHGMGEGMRLQQQVGAGIRTRKYWAYWQSDAFGAMVRDQGFQQVTMQVVDSMRTQELHGLRKREQWINAWLKKR